MQFFNSFFEDEVREGFYVPGMIKRAWPAELEVLSEIDRICKKYNISYFADWGSLLATVRHDGFIPWDDDLDIVMKRADYERFLEVSDRELPEGYAAYNYKNHDDYWLYICRVVGKQRICFEEEHLDRFHQFPYIVGVDIFVLDYVSRDDEAESARDSLAHYSLVSIDKIAECQIKGEEALESLRYIDKVSGKKFADKYWQIITQKDNNKEKDIALLRRDIYAYAEELFGCFSDEDSDNFTQLFPFGMQDKNFRFPKRMYEKTVWLKYENTSMPVPYCYDEVLRKRYGEYMRLVKNAGAHGYPFFETQHKELVKVLDFELPSYKYDVSNAIRTQIGSPEPTYKSYITECMEQIKIYADIKEQLSEEDCIVIQENAINIGNAIEAYLDECTAADIVSLLEALCEGVYSAYQHIVSGERVDSVNDIKTIIGNVCKKVEEEVLSIKEVLFVLFKPECFEVYRQYYNKHIAEKNTRVSVILSPLFYKKYSGEVYDSVYAPEKVTQGVELTDYDSYDVSLHHPDIIYIQQPYDQWNPVMRCDERYYSAVLKNSTDRLIYIPWFIVDEFTDTDYRQYHNMKEYALMPGVVNADTVYLQSENMRKVYIKKICDWAGGDSLEIWEKKLCVAEALTENATEEGNNRKALLYHVEIASFASYPNCTEVIRKNLETFKNNRDKKLDFIWYQDTAFENNLKNLSEKKYVEYLCIKKEYEDCIQFKNENWFLDKQTAEAEKIILRECTAYYGDACRLAMLFNINHKPVMLGMYQK